MCMARFPASHLDGVPAGAVGARRLGAEVGVAASTCRGSSEELISIHHQRMPLRREVFPASCANVLASSCKLKWSQRHTLATSSIDNPSRHLC